MEFKCRLGQQMFLPTPCNRSVGGGKMGRGGGKGWKNPPFPLPLLNGTSFRQIIVPSTPSLNGVGKIIKFTV